MMRRRIVPCLFFLTAFFAPLLVSADSTFSVRDEAASFFDEAGGQFERRLRDEVLFGESSLDFSEWLARRGAVSFDRLVVSPFLRRGEAFAEGFSFVRDVEVRYESPLGQRKGNFGFGALGSLRESAGDVVVWELRGFVGEDDVAGANVGAAYRRLVADNFLAGVNAFFDYERTDADGDFWRWSAGVEAVGRHLDFSANRYWALSDAVMATVGGEVFRVYSADGWDAELRGRVAVRYPVAFRFLDSAEVAARYYVWEGDGDGTGGGDADVSGARYRLGFVPLPQLRFGVEYDDGDGGGKNFGYYVNFRHRLGGSAETALSDNGGDVWSRRFDPVRREHQQHIVRAEAAAGVVTSVELYLSTLTADTAVYTLVPANLSASYAYAVASAEPVGLAASVAVDDSGVVTDAGLVAGGVGGNVVFELTPVAGGAAVLVSVFFRDLSLAVSNADADDKVRLFFSDLSAGDVLTVSVGGTATDLTYAIESATPSAWNNLLSIDNRSGVVNYTGGASENGEVVFSVTDNATGAAVLLTVRFGNLSFAADDITVTLTSDDDGGEVVTLTAMGGAMPYVYSLVSVNPSSFDGSLTIDSDSGVVSDNGLAVAGATEATAFFVVGDDAGFVVTATVAVEVLDDVGVAEDDFALTLTPDDVGVSLVTITASGGDGTYTYALVSTNPALFADSVTVNNLGVVIDSGAASAGATVLTAFFSATDSSGEMVVFVTVMIEVLDEFVLVDDNFELTLVSGDSGMALQTLSVTGGASPYVYATVSADPSAWQNSLAINADGIISDSGAAADRATQATVFFSVTDNIGSVLTATVSLQTFADLVLADDDISLTLNAGDGGTAIQTLMASGGDGDYAYQLISGNGVAIDSSGVITDSGLAAAGAASVTAIFEVTDDFAFTVSATVDIVVFGALAFAEDDISLTLVSGDAGTAVQTLTATGGDGSYTYAVASANPSAWSASLSIDSGSGIITDSGAASAGAATASVVFSATDGDSNVVSATVKIIVLDDLAIAVDNISLALSVADAGAEVATLSVSGGVAPYSYAVVSVNPSGRGDLFAIGNNGVISESGVVTVGGAGTVLFLVTDAIGLVATATVEFGYSAVKYSVRTQQAAVVFNNRIYVIGGTDGGGTADRMNDVWSSADGVNWTEEVSVAAFPGRQGHAAVVHDNKIYIIGGATDAGFLNRASDVWSSGDGVNWTQETPAATHFDGRAFFQAAVLGGTMYVAGGQNSSFSRVNDVWYSTDGASWTEATGAAAFSAREFFAMAALGDSLFVIGGDSGAVNRNVWSSTNGAGWMQETNAAGFSARSSHAAVVFGGEMFVIGGYDGVNKNDVWSSTDGASWTEETASGGFPARNAHSAVVLNERIFVLGGYTGSSNLNDVWSSADGVNWVRH